MKKVLLIDVALDGHHIPYIKNILKNDNGYEYSLVIPKSEEKFDINVINIGNYNFRKFSQYRKWLKDIKEIIKNEKPDIVHLLFGDILYRYFGFGLKKIKKLSPRFVVTFHQLKPQELAKISEKRIFKRISDAIITTDYNYNYLVGKGIKNVLLHEIPHLYDFPLIDKLEAQKKYGIPQDAVVFGSFGIMSEYKRIDLLLDAFDKVMEENFFLIVAGRPDFYKQDLIENKVASYNDKVKLFLTYLSDDDFFYLINSCDYVVTPYSLNFNGTSGPLTEAVWARKQIISSDLRSLGSIVKNNDLGYTFVTDNLDSFVDTLKNAMHDRKEWSSKAEDYRTRTSIEYFVKKLDEIYSKNN